MAAGLLVKEIYASIQGESSWAGLPCVFVRLTGCDLRCAYCDSVYAFRGGERLTVEAILEEVEKQGGKPEACGATGDLPLVEITGGEPLLQAAVHPLMDALCQMGYRVLIETSGAHDISSINPKVHRIVDVKCPSSGESERMCWPNLDGLRKGDEVKFVLATAEDYEFAKEIIGKYRLGERCSVLFSCVAPLSESQKSEELKPMPSSSTILSREAVVDRLLADRLPVRFQLQMHKFIWAPDQTGV